MRFVKFHLPVLIYAGLIFWGSSLERVPIAIAVVDFGDLILHFGQYFVFGILIWRSFTALFPRLGQRWSYLITSAIGVLYAASDEFHQMFVVGRDACVSDWLADTLGLAIGIAAVYIFRLSIKRTNQPNLR